MLKAPEVRLGVARKHGKRRSTCAVIVVKKANFFRAALRKVRYASITRSRLTWCLYAFSGCVEVAGRINQRENAWARTFRSYLP